MLHLRMPIERVVNRHGVCSRHSEDDLNAVMYKTLHDKLTTGHFVHDVFCQTEITSEAGTRTCFCRGHRREIWEFGDSGHFPWVSGNCSLSPNSVAAF